MSQRGSERPDGSGAAQHAALNSGAVQSAASKSGAAQPAASKKCSSPRCTNDAASTRSKFCTACFKKNASLASSKRKVFGGGGVLGNSGNTTTARGKGVLGNGGNTTTTRGKGVLGNGGNTTTGRKKKRAGKRSGVRRSAKRALVVKKRWLDLILAGEKTWEIRGSSTAKRGWIHFAESQAGGKLMGRARLVDCFPVSRKAFVRNFHHHRVSSWSMVPYDTPYAWVLEDCEKFGKAFQYEHKQGAVIWVDV